VKPLRAAAALITIAGPLVNQPQSARLQTEAISSLRTRAESTNFEETSTHADVERFVAGLREHPRVHIENFGKTEEGRNLPLVVVSDPRVTTPEAARRSGRPIVFIQANIHAGEVEGKEASLLLARRLVVGDLQPLARQLVVLIAPDYNADGNDRISVQNRTAQNGPIGGVGTRENARGLDLNRDFMKLDSAEARALVGLMNRWDPHLTIDLHTTNGSYHGYHLTYSPTLNPNADARLVQFERDTLLPAAGAATLKKHGFRTYYYGNFSSENGGRELPRVDPSKPGDVAWRTFDHRPRFGNNYVGLRNRLAMLSEAYSYLDFKGRVDVTAAFTEELLRATAANARTLLALTTQADRALTGTGVNPASEKAQGWPTELGVAFEIRALPQPVEILVGDVTRQPSPRSGRDMLLMANLAVPVRMKDYGVFVPTRTVTMPAGWLIAAEEAGSARMRAVLDRLQWHGVRVRTVAAAAQVPVETFIIEKTIRSERAFQNRLEARLEGRPAPAQLSAARGSLFIPATQPLGRLAFYLLEAESDDGVVAWSVLDEGLMPGSTYPIYRVLNASTLRLAQ
jgi:hypothetical protein